MSENDYIKKMAEELQSEIERIEIQNELLQQVDENTLKKVVTI